MARAETGLMVFGEDWCGVFVRGKHAHHYARALRAVLAAAGGGARELDRRAVESLATLLEDSDHVEHGGPPPDVQRVRAFETVADFGLYAVDLGGGDATFWVGAASTPEARARVREHLAEAWGLSPPAAFARVEGAAVRRLSEEDARGLMAHDFDGDPVEPMFAAWQREPATFLACSEW